MDRSIAHGLDASPRCKAAGALLSVLGAGDAWPHLATDLKTGIRRTDTFCGCELHLNSERTDSHACGFCTRLSPLVNASCQSPPAP